MNVLNDLTVCQEGVAQPPRRSEDLLSPAERAIYKTYAISSESDFSQAEVHRVCHAHDSSCCPGCRREVTCQETTAPKPLRSDAAPFWPCGGVCILQPPEGLYLIYAYKTTEAL